MTSSESIWVVEWSAQQRCMHIHTLVDALATNMAMINHGGHIPSYVIVAVCRSRSDAHTIADEIEPRLRASTTKHFAKKAREASAIPKPATGWPVSFRVIACYADGVEMDTALLRAPADDGVCATTDDEEFGIWIERRSSFETPSDEPNESEWQFNPETDVPREGVPF